MLCDFCQEREAEIFMEQMSGEGSRKKINLCMSCAIERGFTPDAKNIQASLGNLFKELAEKKYGTVDNKAQLELSDDAARANWGGRWRMPTRAEQDELREKCTWTWTTQGGHKGYKVTSKSNGNSIFLPAAGYRDGTSIYYASFDGFYWSSTAGNAPGNATCVYFTSSSVTPMNLGRGYGCSVRLVTEVK